MKKMIIGLVMFMVLGISACSNANVKLISEEEAKGFALKDANVDTKDATFLSISLDKDDDKEYEIKFKTNEFKYDYTIDATNGDIRDQEKEALPQPTTNNTTVEEEFLQKALTEFGFTKDQVLNIQGNKDLDDGREIYEVSFYKDNVKYSCDYDIATGTLVSSDIDND